MSLAGQSENTYAQFSSAEVGDYVALLKPRVMSLVVFTAFVGLMLAPAPMHPVMAFTALLCIAVGAGAAVPLGVTPWLLGFVGAVYAVVALVTGAMMLALAVRVLTVRSERPAKHLFAFSILYLFLLLAFLLIDRAVVSLAG